MSRLSPVYKGTGSSLGTRMPWTSFRDAGVMMELADFAERNVRYPDHDLIAELRSNALAMRIEAFKAIVTRRR